MPFSAFFPAGVADPALIGRLSTQGNLQGLLRYSVAGLCQVLRRGRFTLPESVVRATSKFREEADPLRSFVHDRLSAGVGFTPRTDVYASYAMWAASNGYSQLNAHRFYEQLLSAMDQARLNVQPAVRDGKRGFKNIVVHEL